MTALTFNEAVRARRDNENRAWCNYETKGRCKDDPSTARDRFKTGGPFIVQNKPRFSVPSGAKVYTIGSCFARNVEMALSEHGFDLPTLSEPFDQGIYMAPTPHPHTVLNKYHPPSMAFEIMRGLGGPAGEVVELGPDKWFDPTMSFIRPMPKAMLDEARASIQRITEQLTSADVLVTTFGLTEYWTDEASGTPFNNNITAVAPYMKDRLRFRNARVTEIYDTMKAALLALHEAAPALKVVMTVSPVPMNQTFTAQDVVSANTYSKSALRSAAQMLFEDLPFVDYFPSYEMVTNSPRDITWSDDQIHVRDKVIHPVIAEFVSRYVA